MPRVEIGLQEACKLRMDIANQWCVPRVMLCVHPVLSFWQDSGSGVLLDLAQPSGIPHVPLTLNLKLHMVSLTKQPLAGPILIPEEEKSIFTYNLTTPIWTTTFHITAFELDCTPRSTLSPPVSWSVDDICQMACRSHGLSAEGTK